MTSELSAAKPGRIGLCAYSLIRRVRSESAWDRLGQLNLPREAKKVFGIDTVELYNGFMETTERRYLDRIREQAKEEGVCLHGMAVDVPYGDICSANETDRKIGVAQNMVYVPVAQRLGLAYFRINTSGSTPPAPGEIDRAIRSLKELTDVAWDRGIRVCIENHGGLSLDPQAVRQIIETVGKDRMATVPDIGNFGSEESAYGKIAQLAPFAVSVHAKLHHFDDSGEATNISLKRMAEAIAATGFRGTWSIETTSPDAAHTNENVLKSKALLQKYLG